MNAIQGVVPVCLVLIAVVPVDGRVQSGAAPASIAGAWTLNPNLSDPPAENADRPREVEERRGGGGRGGGGRGGGFGRGGSTGRGSRGRPDSQAASDEAARMREALRDVLDPPRHLVITETDSMIVLTSPDGRTLRLSPDGKPVKDDNTKVERKTRREAGRVVSEISGLGGRMTQTFAINPELRQLRVTVQIEARGDVPARSITHVYDADGGR